jgi:F-type H+-transporting ATPase subunit b
MLIDWFTVGAQVLNFLILVWLLKRFLYKPILNAVDAREKRIAAELAGAAAKQTAADSERQQWQGKSKALDEQRSTLLAKAADDAKAERGRLLAQAHKDADSWRAKQADALRNDQIQLRHEIIRMARTEVFAIARKTLADLAAAGLEERMGEVFTRRLREMDGKAKESLAAALKTPSEPAVVRSAFEMPANARATIQNALNETFSADIHVRFETAPDAICGIELTANGQKLAWSIAEYLAALDRNVGRLLEAEPPPAPQPVPAPPAAIADHASTQ